MVSCSIWFSSPSFWMGGGLKSRCVGRVYGVDVASSWHFKLFHEEDAPSNNPHVHSNIAAHFASSARRT